MSSNFLHSLPTAAVVATISTPDDLNRLETVDPISTDIADVLEFRLDSLINDLDRCETIASAQNLPLLFTARHPDEGGANALPAPERAKLLARFFPLAAAIDVETQSLDALAPLVAEAKAADIAVIASFHDFEKTPANEQLSLALAFATNAEVDLAKFAIYMDDEAFLFEMVELLKFRDPELPELSIMGMGPLGKLSRLVLSHAGSRLNYGYLFTPNAPGQWAASELRSLIDQLAE